MKPKRAKNSIRRTMRAVLVCVEVIAMLLVCIGSYAWGKASQINKVDIDVADIIVNEEVVDDEIMTGYTNVALFGLDTRQGKLDSGVNSDTMIVASVNNESGKINLASLYRDTYIDVGNGSYGKANSAYSYGGPELALSMMNQAMDLNLQKFIAADFKALTVAIDCLGGLDVDMTWEEVFWMNGYIAETSKESGIWSPTLDDQVWTGVHHLNGTQATAFCRIRYTQGDDFKRTERQRYILSLIFEKAKTMDMATLNSIADQVFPLVYTNMTMSEMVKIGMKIINFEMGESTGLPKNYQTGNVGKCGDCVVPQAWADEVAELHKVLFGEEDYTPSEKVKQIGQTSAGAEFTDPALNEDNGIYDGMPSDYVDYDNSYYDGSDYQNSYLSDNESYTDYSGDDYSGDSDDSGSYGTESSGTETYEDPGSDQGGSDGTGADDGGAADTGGGETPPAEEPVPADSGGSDGGSAEGEG